MKLVINKNFEVLFRKLNVVLFQCLFIIFLHNSIFYIQTDLPPPVSLEFKNAECDFQCLKTRNCSRYGPPL